MKLARIALSLSLLLSLSGCISFDVLVKVRPDGSGTIVQTTKMKTEFVEQFRQMMSGMAEAFGGTDGEKGEGQSFDLFSEEDAKKEATKLGEGVRFVSAKKTKDAQYEGMTAIYEFDDIRKVTVDQSPKAPEMPGMETSGGKSEELLFGFDRKGGTSTLTIRFPEDAEIDTEAVEEAKAEAGGTPDAAQLAQMRQMFDGMRIGIAVEVDGRIVETNGAHRDGDRVTILEMDFGKLLENEKAFEKLSKANPETLADAQKLLQDVPGFKVPLGDEIRIRFK